MNANIHINISLKKKFIFFIHPHELNKIWRTNRKVKGFFIDKVKGGYSVAIAGFITFLPFRPLIRGRISNDQFTIEISPKGRILWCSNSSSQTGA